MAMNMDALLNIKANVNGLNNIVALNRGLSAVETTAKGVTGAMRGMTGAASGLSGALGALAPLMSVAGLVGLAKGALDAGDKLNDLSQATGVSVEALARFRKAAATSGTDIDSVSKALVKLSKSMLDASVGGKQQVAAFKALGISVTDSKGQLKSADGVMLEIADKFKQMPDGVVKTALALKYFGKAGAEMIPMLNMGGDAIDKLSVKMTTAFAQKADAYNDKLAMLSGRIGALGADLLIALLPALDAVTSAVLAGVGAFNSLSEPVKGLAVAGTMLAIAWGPITGVMSGASAAFAVGTAAIQALRVQVALAAMEGIPALSAAIMLIPGWGWALAGVTALGALSAALYANNTAFKNWVDNVVAIVRNDFSAAMGQIASDSKAAFGAVKSAMQSIGSLGSQAASSLSSAFGGAFGRIAQNAQRAFASFGQTIAGWWNSIPAPIRGLLSGAGAGLGNALKTMPGVYSSIVAIQALGRSAVKAGAAKAPAVNVGGGFTPDIEALSGGGGGGGGKGEKAKKERESQLAGILAANGLFRSQEIIKERMARAGLEQNQLEKLRLEYIDRGVQLLAEAESIQREKIPQAEKDAKLLGIQDKLMASAIQYQREADAYQKNFSKNFPSYLSNIESAAAGYSKVLDYSKQLTAEQEKQQQLATGIAGAIGGGMASAFDALISGSEEFGTSLRKIASGVLTDIAKQLLQIYVINTAINAISNLFGPKTGGFFPGVKFNPASFAMPSLLAANGMVAANGIQPFATGGIVDRPTLFRFASGGAGNLGLMGEAGPEAIMPLKRGRDGKLGVAGGGGQTNVTVNVDANGSNVQGDAGKAGQLGKVLSLAVQQELIKHKRPGGLLSS